ncbi:alpha-amylase family glycosyl hydrolase, partial [Candidatus Pseudoruminococcus sp.]|uniref:alpha-amylase family glycosyl hydrolase n=1 Tax=Candidatus Pseudoruminococcus sp. TaxID=3101048 RepID=UPI00399B5C0D
MQKRKSTAGILKRCLSGFLAVAAVATSGLFINPIKAEAASSNVLSNSERGVIYANSRTDFRDESIYFLITTRFYDGDPSNNARTSEDEKAKNPESDPSWRGDFKGLIDKLDYIKALGFTAIWITPVVENNSGYDYHGYHAYDFSAVDKRYESNGITYQDLIDAVHAKGMKVIQDVVLNHTCNWGEKNLLKIDNPVYGGGRSNYVMPSGASLDTENIYHHNGFCGGGDWDNYEAQRKTIADDCFDLETENPKVYNYLVDCYTKYINMGVDGFRVDTVKHINRLTLNTVFMPAFQKAGGDNFYMFGEVCTKGHDVWYRDQPGISTSFYTWDDDNSWKSRWTTNTASNESLVEEHYKSHNDTSKQPTSDNAFLKGNEYHTPNYSDKSDMNVIDFQMHWSFNSANGAFNTARGEDKYFNDSTWNVVYVDSHDYAPDECQTLRYTGGTDAWAENLSLMFTFRGIPCVYYGSEIEFQAGKPIDVGPNSPLSQTGRAYYGDHIEGTVSTSDFTVFGNISGEVQNTLNSTLSQHIMRLNRIRQAIPALRKGQYSTEGCSGNMAFKRRYTDSNTDSFVCVAISGGATFSGIPNGRYVDAVTGDVQNVSGGTLTANVSGKGNMKVYVLDTAKTPAPGRVITNGKYLTDGGAAELIGPETIEQIPATGITVSKSSVSILEGNSETVTAKVTPDNATNKTVTWTSSNPTVATVAGGKITGVSVGIATITAKTSNGLTATVSVKVNENPNIVKPTGVTISPTSATVEAGKETTLTATVTPSNATNKEVTWTSSNTSVATVSGGKVKGVAEGTAVITATTSNGKTATVTVTVTGKTITYLDGDGVYFEKPSGWGSNINVYFFSNNQTVGASWPGTAMKDLGDGLYGFKYDTTDSNLMVIFNDGSNQTDDLKYVKNGYYNSSGYVRTVERVTEIKPTAITLNKTNIDIDVTATEQLTATITPSNATNKSVTWTSSNTSVATVSNGLITPKSVGVTTITATTSNGLKATANVTVAENYTYELMNTSTISATSIKKGSSITMKGSAEGGRSPYTYTYLCKSPSSSSYTTLKTTTATSYKHTPTSAGTYSYAVRVTDSTGNSLTNKFTVTVKATTTALANNSTISATSINFGSSIKITAKATGGKAPYKYRYFYRLRGDIDWTAITGTTTATTCTHKPTKAANYQYAVRVFDSTGKYLTKTFDVNVKKVAELANASTISATSINLGSSIKMTAKATGGKAPYKYSYFCKPAGEIDWVTLKNATTATTYTYKPTKVGTYYYAVRVFDSTGKNLTKQFTVNVNKVAELANASTISATSINLGSSIKMTAKATGGKA